MYFSGLNIHLDRQFQEASVMLTPNLERTFQIKKTAGHRHKYFFINSRDSQQTKNRRELPQSDKNSQLTPYIMVKGLNTCSLRFGLRQECTFSSLLFHILLDFFVTVIRQEEEIKSIEIGKNKTDFIYRGILFSQGCHTKVPQTRCQRQQKNVLEARSPKSRFTVLLKLLE